MEHKEVRLETLRSMESQGVKFLLMVPNEQSGFEWPFEADKVMLYLKDKDQFFADNYGVTKEQFRGWEQDEYCVYCSANTRKGVRCKGVVIGGYMVSPSRWAELQGSYCHTHGEGTATYSGVRLSGGVDL